MGLFNKIKGAFSSKKDETVYNTGLSTTQKSFGSKLLQMFQGDVTFDDAWYDNLLGLLIQSDVSLKSAQKILKGLRKRIKKNMDDTDALNTLIELIEQNYGEDIAPYTLEEGRLNVIMIVGVNGSGKTTTCAKLAKRYKDMGYKVLLVGGDTFRAAGSNQLKLWAQNLEIDFVGGNDNQDPASVYVDAARYAKDNEFDLMICDSAGRLQNKINLMNELEKMRRVLIKETGFIDQTYLVLDGNTGQNGLAQAKTFTEVADVTSIIVTKLDGSPKGGVLLSIKDELGVKASFIGLGESVEDLRPFEIKAYLSGMVFGDEY
ncbi:signal recognition particle-docking protein FtsY [Erysipelothrix larvae]|uniref:Signal recognition particle-docking protein FtsY n=1 Tax=Erysipelothrix larvae TaxID=1514105 RepID=A0A0X8GZI4_9FIRM|nr:signal recognition particle-docking protein FtsY [Erysipelothrix larvae]AMC93297.1 signal recognition particle-docking protein FtsY [Erysipelothrix larvae]